MNTNSIQFDPLDEKFLVNWAPILNEMREQCPIYRHDDTLSKTISVFRYEDVKNLYSNCELYSSVRGAELERGALGDALSLIGIDPPDHTRLRQAINKVFTPRMIRELQPDVERNTDQMFDELVDQGEFDVVEDCAGRLTVYMISQLVGIPREDRALIRDWTTKISEHDGAVFFIKEERPDLDQAVFEVNREMQDYFAEKVDERLKNPKDDILTQLVQSGLNRREAISFAKILALAGNETTTTLITHLVKLLIDNPAQQQNLRDNPKYVQNAIDEVLRLAPALRGLGRHATQHQEWHGLEINKGDFIYGWIAAANRDPRFIERPDDFDVTRSPSRHLTFGHGIHTCLGNALARLETRVFLDTLIKRTRAVERTSELGMDPIPSPNLMAIRHQYVRFHAA